MGLVNRVVPAGRARELREELCRHHRRQRAADGQGGQVHRQRDGQGREQARPRARRRRWSRHCFASNDYIEGRRAFMEKRKPAFTGRERVTRSEARTVPRARTMVTGRVDRGSAFAGRDAPGENKAASCRGRGRRFGSINHGGSGTIRPRHAGGYGVASVELRGLTKHYGAARGGRQRVADDRARAARLPARARRAAARPRRCG